MTTQEIRQKIHVNNFSIDRTGIKVNYLFEKEIRFLELNVNESASALDMIGVIDGWWNSLVAVDQTVMSWEDYAHDYGMYQYAAILLVINKELQDDTAQSVRLLNHEYFGERGFYNSNAMGSI